MTLNAVNHLNSGLMLLACGLAFALPFETFLLAYAVLGPLHYLTQISWLHDRKYFARQGRDPLWLLALTLAATVSAMSISDVPTALRLGASIGCLAVASAAVMAFTPSLAARVATISGLGVLLLVLEPSPWVILVFGILLPSLIHVFVFTALFVLYGSLKTRSLSGYLSFAVMMACGASCLLFLPAADGTVVSQTIREAYGPFSVLNRAIAEVVGWPAFERLDQVFHSPMGIATTRFVAFAYTYHYLNWFAKTKVIGWHEIPRRRALLIGLGWLVAVGIYSFSYRAGFLVLYALSLLHVFLELPLDHVALVGVGKEIRGRLRPSTA